MMTLLLFIGSTVWALPPIPFCASQLITPRALAAYQEVTGAHPSFYRAHVGFLLEAWPNDDGKVEDWGVYDTHHGQKIYRHKYEYYCRLYDGDLVFIYDRNWRPLGSGEFLREQVAFLYRGFLGMTSRSTSPRLLNWQGESADPPGVLELWMEGQNAIVLSQTNAEDRARWARESEPDYNLYLQTGANPRFVHATDFVYPLAHYETALEGTPLVRREGDEIWLALQTDGQTLPVLRGDYIFLFDADDRLIETHKKNEPHSFVTFGEAITPEEIAQVLGRARRVVVIKHHRFIVERD